MPKRRPVAQGSMTDFGTERPPEVDRLLGTSQAAAPYAPVVLHYTFVLGAAIEPVWELVRHW